MWVDLLSMTAVGLLAACLVYILKHTLRRKGRHLPRWILPAFIGTGMIGYSIWNEYTWYGRITSSLPLSVAVVSEGKRSVFWAPWTHIWPVTVRFIAMDTRTRFESPRRPDLVMAELLLVERWLPTRKVPMMFDCQLGQRADLQSGIRITPDGIRGGTQWHTMEPDDPVLHAACNVQAIT